MAPSTDTTSPSGQFMDVNGVSLYYEQHGSGHPIVLIHGGLSSSVMWRGVIPYLADEFQVITIDSRGHGRSSNPTGELSTEQVADDVAAVIEALHLDHPTVGGWSEGGQVTVEVGLRHPGVAGALIVGAALDAEHMGAFHAQGRYLFGLDDTGAVNVEHFEQQLGDLVQGFKDMQVGGEEQWNTLVQQTAMMWLSYLGPIREDFTQIHTPTLVLGGDRDTLIPLDAAVSMYRMLPHAELGICPHADHLSVVSRASVFAAMIKDFVERQWQAHA